MNQEQNQKLNTRWVDISEITRSYLPISRRKARKFVALYLTQKRVGNKIFVERAQLERLLSDPDRELFPLDV